MALEDFEPQLPHFTGSDPTSWISQSELYFRFYSISGDERFSYVIEVFEDEPFYWFNSWFRSDDLTWNDFTIAMLTHFVDGAPIQSDLVALQTSGSDLISPVDSATEAVIHPSGAVAFLKPNPSLSSIGESDVAHVFDEMPDRIATEIDSEDNHTMDYEVFPIQPEPMVVFNESYVVKDARINISDHIVVIGLVIPSMNVVDLVVLDSFVWNPGLIANHALVSSRYFAFDPGPNFINTPYSNCIISMHNPVGAALFEHSNSLLEPPALTSVRVGRSAIRAMPFAFYLQQPALCLYHAHSDIIYVVIDHEVQYSPTDVDMFSVAIVNSTKHNTITRVIRWPMTADLDKMVLRGVMRLLTDIAQGSCFLRVLNGFLAQGGDISDPYGTEGELLYGLRFADENFALHYEKKEMFSKANSGPNTIGSFQVLDSKFNIYQLMVCKWYDWHFPDLSNIVRYNYWYANAVMLLGYRINPAQLAISKLLLDELETELKATVVISMGTKTSAIDVIRIKDLWDRVLSLSAYKALFLDISCKLHISAPNLIALIGELGSLNSSCLAIVTLLGGLLHTNTVNCVNYFTPDAPKLLFPFMLLHFGGIYAIVGPLFVETTTALTSKGTIVAGLGDDYVRSLIGKVWDTGWVVNAQKVLMYIGHKWHTILVYTRKLFLFPVNAIVVQMVISFLLQLVRIHSPIQRLPTLVIHWDRGVNDGFIVNVQHYLVFMLATFIHTTIITVVATNDPEEKPKDTLNTCNNQPHFLLGQMLASALEAYFIHNGHTSFSKYLGLNEAHDVHHATCFQKYSFAFAQSLLELTIFEALYGHQPLELACYVYLANAISVTQHLEGASVILLLNNNIIFFPLNEFKEIATPQDKFQSTKQHPNFHLEDKVNLKGGSNVMNWA